jgi:hypothetical protein
MTAGKVPVLERRDLSFSPQHDDWSADFTSEQQCADHFLTFSSISAFLACRTVNLVNGSMMTCVNFVSDEEDQTISVSQEEES